MPNFAVQDAQLLIGYNNSTTNRLPGEIETTWRAQFPSHANILDAACGQVYPMTLQASNYPSAGMSVYSLIDQYLAQFRPGTYSMAVNPNAGVAYLPGGQGHGGSAAVYSSTSYSSPATPNINDNGTQIPIVLTVLIWMVQVP